MSMKLVRKFLQQDDVQYVEDDAAAAKKRRKRRREQSSGAALTEEELLQSTVKSMLYLDKAMVTHTGKSDSKNKAMRRIQAESKKAKKREKTVKHAIVGNSRSSSSQLRLPSVPTFNKKRHKKEQEEKRLQEIAKLLNKQKQKKAKSSSSK